MKLYHYDALGRLSIDRTISLQPCPKEYGRFCDLFPDGISEFGIRVLKPFSHPVFRFDYMPYSSGKTQFTSTIAFADLSFSLDGMAIGLQEYNLELVRRAFAPLSPSRLSSFFALGSPADLSSWHHTDLLRPKGRLFEIDVAEAVKLDARCICKVIRFDWTAAVTMAQSTEDEKLCDIGFSADALLNAGLSYWEGVPTGRPMWEYLVKPPVQIGREVPMPASIPLALDQS